MSKLFFLSQVVSPAEGLFQNLAMTDFPIETKEKIQIIDITDTVEKAMSSAGFVGGLVLVQILHTTARLWHNENEPLLHADVVKLLSGMIPEGFKFGHDNFEIRKVNMCEGECANGDSHFKAALFSASLLLQAWPENGKVRFHLGRWGRILLVELDGPRPERTVSVMMSGYFKK
ncbi:MAG: secondary thiamine-phosphate synthase enzyme YjbQ [Patescibacteria group bacterium]